jgi:hypothetical protein
MAPEQADAWLGNVLKHAILSFQDAYQGEAALVFWLPAGQRRVHVFSGAQRGSIRRRSCSPKPPRPRAFSIYGSRRLRA